MRGMVWRPPSPVRRQLGRSARGGGPVSRLRRKRPASPTPQAPQSARPGTFSARETRSAAGDDRCAEVLGLPARRRGLACGPAASVSSPDADGCCAGRRSGSLMRCSVSVAALETAPGPGSPVPGRRAGRCGSRRLSGAGPSAWPPVRVQGVRAGRGMSAGVVVGWVVWGVSGRVLISRRGIGGRGRGCVRFRGRSRWLPGPWAVSSRRSRGRWRPVAGRGRGIRGRGRWRAG